MREADNIKHSGSDHSDHDIGNDNDMISSSAPQLDQHPRAADGTLPSDQSSEKRRPRSRRSSTGSMLLKRQSLLWTPPWLRWDTRADANHDLDWGKIILFGLTAACSVANLYYSHPILNVLANDFGISDERASLVPTIMQAGYATGLLFVIPMGDLLPRRPFVIALMLATALLWMGCILTTSFSTFLGLSYVVGATTVTPQLMFPLTTQYAPQKHKATMIAIVMSGLFFGIAVARVLSGVVTQFIAWRIVYWISFGWQGIIVILLFVTMPDYPVLQPPPGTARYTYPGLLLKIAKLPFKSPVLTQQSIIAFMVMGVYTLFWTTLTFQLTHVYGLETLSIGLFALIGLAPVLMNPLVSRFLTSRVHPTGTLLVSLTTYLLGVSVGTGVGNLSIAGPVIWACLGDTGMNTSVVASRMAFAHVEPQAQNAVNAVYMVFTFCGQLCGTAAGNALYARGGWTASGGLAIGMIGLAMLVNVVKGPHEPGWVGWRGGWDLGAGGRSRGAAKRPAAAADGDDDTTRNQQEEQQHAVNVIEPRDHVDVEKNLPVRDDGAVHQPSSG